MSDESKTPDVKDEGTSHPATPTPEPAKTEPVATATLHPVKNRLAELGITDEKMKEAILGLGAESVEDLNSLKETDLTGVGVPVLKARKIISGLHPSPMADGNGHNPSFDAVLPAAPDDASWLSALRAGGVLKIEQSTVVAAIRAALADRFGLYDLPSKLLAEMESFIDATEEQVGEEYWNLRNQLTRRNYGDLFKAIPGLNASYVTEARKNELLARISQTLWPAISSFNRQLGAWQESWMQGSANPAMMMAALASLGGGGVGLPPGMMQPPDCGTIRDAAEAVNDALNRTFRGTGVQVTAALAYEANEIKKMLESSRLPSLCGVASRDLLLKKLKVSVPATYPRMEQNLTRFMLGIMQTERVASGNEELQYFGSLYMLGTQIPWEDLEGSGSHLGIGGRSRKTKGYVDRENRYDDDDE